ncbi:MAG: RNA methyltransferase [Candidatus Cloacimonetes bacterium]|nr:RNA methyltransferase [Candidatus Cloacimonadota bacterium]
MKFSRKKFLLFNKVKQEKILLEFIRDIEHNWQCEPARLELLIEFNNCLNFVGYEIDLDFKLLSLREFLSFAVPFEHRFGKDLKDDDLLVLKNDGQRNDQSKLPLYLILDNLRSSFNVGSIFRTAECFGVSKIFLCGYTATPENPKVCKTAMGTENYIEWKRYDTTGKAIEFLKENNVKIYALETTSKARNISKVKFEKPCALILGNEALGISKEVLRSADEIVSITVSGWKNSLNVGVTAAICCYEISGQWGDYSR